MRNYNIPSNNRELQHVETIKSDIEIITYQVITGNYSTSVTAPERPSIITYQVITGNYSFVQLLYLLGLL